MKERIALLLLIIALWVGLFIFQNYFDTFWAIVCLTTFMLSYTLYMQIACKHKKRKLTKTPLVINKDYKPFVSILIPAHNEQNVIEKTVENILCIDYENYEIIIIDDRSTDNTAKVLLELEKKHDKIKVLIRNKDAFPGKSAVLNDALPVSKGEAILVFDADARIEPDFLVKLLPALEPKDVGAVQARKVVSNRNYNLLTRCQDNEMALDTHFQIGRDAVKGAVELRGNGELIKREAIIEIGGWNNYTITDDLDMSTTLQIHGWDIRFCPEVCVYEEAVLEFIPLLRQRRRWVEGSIRRYLENFKDILFSKDMSLRTGFDMTAYISEFILPFWWISEICIQAFRYIKGYEHSILSSMAIALGIGAFFLIGLVYSLRKYLNLKLKDRIVQAVQTSLYLLVVWFPLVIFIVFKIIFTKKTLDWGKTNHGELMVEEVKIPDLVN